MRALRRGLRRQLLLALLLTSAVTLGVAATVLLSPLRDRLRERSVDNLEAAVLTLRPSFEQRIDSGGQPFLEAFELRERTDARVLVGNPSLSPPAPAQPPGFLADTETGAPTGQPVRVALTALRERSMVTTVDGNDVRIALPLFSRERPGTVAGVVVAERRLTEVMTAVDQVRNALLVAAAVGLLVAVALAVALSSTLLRRLGRLRNAALRISDEGIDAPVPHDSGLDEVGDLARAFGRMQEELRSQEEARRSFVSTASHELRTPLTMLQGTMELLEEDLRDGRLDIADAQRQVASARRELRRLTSLAGELLDLSRLDASVPLRSEGVELGELGRAVAAEFTLPARDRGVELDVVPPPGDCWARADPDAVARVARILLDNALRYGPPGEPVRLSAYRTGAQAVIEVADRGPGIHPVDQERIFERFQRGRSTGSESGFGLGLAIGRELAQRMGGTLELAGAEAPGARFVLTLPSADTDAPAARDRPGERPAGVSS